MLHVSACCNRPSLFIYFPSSFHQKTLLFPPPFLCFFLLVSAPGVGRGEEEGEEEEEEEKERGKCKQCVLKPLSLVFSSLSLQLRERDSDQENKEREREREREGGLKLGKKGEKKSLIFLS